MVGLPVPDLPFTLWIVRIDRHTCDAHRTTRPATLPIEALTSVGWNLLRIEALAMLRAMVVSLVQYSSCVLLTGSPYHLIAMLQAPSMHCLFQLWLAWVCVLWWRRNVVDGLRVVQLGLILIIILLLPGLRSWAWRAGVIAGSGIVAGLQGLRLPL